MGASGQKESRRQLESSHEGTADVKLQELKVRRLEGESKDIGKCQGVGEIILILLLFFAAGVDFHVSGLFVEEQREA